MQNLATPSRKSRITLLTGGVLVLTSAVVLVRLAGGQQANLALAPADGGQKTAAPAQPANTRPSPGATRPASLPPSAAAPIAAARDAQPAASQPAAFPTARGDAQQVPSPPANHDQVEYYPFNDATRHVLSAWQQLATRRSDFRVVIDEKSSQAVVMASPAVQSQIRQQLNLEQPPAAAAAPAGRYGESAAPAASPAVNTPVAQEQQSSAPAAAAEAKQENQALAPPPSTASLRLQNLPGAELRPRLEQIYARPLPTGNDASGAWHTITVEAPDDSRVTLAVNHETSEVRIAGNGVQVANWQSIIQALDSPRTPAGDITEVVATKPGYEPYVRRAIGALQLGGVAARGTAAVASMLFQQAGGQTALPPPGGAAGQAGQQSQAVPATVGGQAALPQLAAEGMLGPVDIRFIEGSNIVIIRGRQEDVAQVREIIRQIEEITRESAPQVRIHPLQYVDSTTMGALLNRIYTRVYLARLGALDITAIAKPNAILLVGPQQTVQMVIDMLIVPLDVPVSPQMRFEVFPLKNIPAANAKVTVDTFLYSPDAALPAPPLNQTDDANAVGLTPRAVTVAVTFTNSLIVAAGAQDIAQIAELIRRIDQPPEIAAQVKVFEIINGDAVSLVQTLQQLFSVGQTADTPAASAGYGQDGLVPLIFTVDARTNSIIAVGTFEQLEVVNNILTVLDSAEIRERTTRVIRLENAFAVNVQTAVQLWIQQQRQIEITSGIVTPFSLYQRDLIIIPEQSTNNLIISAENSVIERIIRDVIKPLDQPPPMVTIQVLIAEVRLTDTDEFGVELGIQDAVLFNRTMGNIPGFNFLGQALGNNVSPETLVQSNQVGAQGVSHLAVGRVNSELGFGGFVFSAQSESVNVLLRALQEKRRLEILSRPQITVVDAQVGTVQVGQQVPVIIGSTPNELTGSFTNEIGQQQVGLILEVRPLISPTGRVVMEVYAEKSEVGPEAEGIPIQISDNGAVLRSPRIDLTNAWTVVSAMDGQTVVLGGLLATRKVDVHRRVPLVADIPLIGDLFRFDAVNEERRELLIILTPRVIREPAQMDRLRQIESSRMSWILRDVVALNGPSGLRDRCDEWFPGEVDEVYPSMMPPGSEFCPPGEQMMTPMHGPMMDSSVPIYGPTNTTPSNAPQPPQQPAQGDLTKNRYGTEAGMIQPARFEAAARVTPASGAAPSRLPQVK